MPSQHEAVNRRHGVQPFDGERVHPVKPGRRTVAEHPERLHHKRQALTPHLQGVEEVPRPVHAIDHRDDLTCVDQSLQLMSAQTANFSLVGREWPAFELPRDPHVPTLTVILVRT